MFKFCHKASSEQMALVFCLLSVSDRRSVISQAYRKKIMDLYLKNHPRIHILNNYITATDAVNAVLAVGGTAIGGDAPEEVSELTAASDALVLNTGTPSADRAKAFLIAGKTANEKKVPIILDPVGVGATAARKKMIKGLLKEVSVSCLRGNVSEIRTICGFYGLLGESGEPGSVEAAEEKLDERVILDLSDLLKCVVIMSGERVEIAYANEGYFEVLPGGSPMQKYFTGGGCMMTAVLGSFMGNAKKGGSTLLKALRDGVMVYEKAAGQAEIRCLRKKTFGTMSYKNTLLDLLSLSGKSPRKVFSGDELALYAVTDRKVTAGKNLMLAVEEAILGGATMIQLREKELDDEAFISSAIVIKKMCDNYHVPLIINDRADICLKVGASGVHLGQDDGDIRSVRELLGKDCIIGATAHNLKEALKAEADGADYLGVGAAFGSGTKTDAKALTSLDTYKEITGAVSVPVVAIGGINLENAGKLAGTGIAGIAVISGIFGAMNIEKATKALKEKVKEEILK